MKIATTIGYLYPLVSTPPEAIRAYVDTGFQYLDYSFYTMLLRENSPYLEESDRFWKKEIEDSIHAAEECSMTFVQAHTPGYNPANPNCDHAKCMRAVQRSIEACGMLQIPCTVIHTSINSQYLYPENKKEYFEYNRSFLLPLLETAEKNGVTLCFENTSTGNVGKHYFPRTPEEMNEFAAFMDHPFLKCCWDVGHALMEGHADQYNELTALKENLCAVHIHDNNGLTDQHLPPYCGKLQLDSILRALVDMDFKGAFTFEADYFMNSDRTEKTPLARPSLELQRESLALLYKIGKSALETYGVFEG